VGLAGRLQLFGANEIDYPRHVVSEHMQTHLGTYTIIGTTLEPLQNFHLRPENNSVRADKYQAEIYLTV
jgi:hypothetical protein